MRTIFLLCISCCWLQVHAQFHVDTPHYTILPYNDQTKSMLDGRWDKARGDSLSPEGVDGMEGLILDAYQQWTRDTSNKWNRLFPLNQYRRQYVALVNQKGEHEVWIQMLCETWGRDWKHEILVVDDGGPCIVHIHVNRTTRKVTQFVTNGVASIQRKPNPFGRTNPVLAKRS